MSEFVSGAFFAQRITTLQCMFQLLEDLYLYFITKGPSYLVIAHNIKSEVLLLDYIEQVLL